MYRFPAISNHSRKSPFRSISAKRSGGGFTAAKVLALSPIAWFRWGVGITVATGVSQWSDQSGNGHHLLQATGAAQPTKQADGSILFDGVAQFLKCTGFTLVQPETVYILFQQVGWTSTSTVFDGNAFNGGRLLQATASPNMQIFAGTTAANTSPTLAIGAYGVIAAVFNGASSGVQLNENSQVTSNAGANNLSGFTLGVGGGGTLFANIQVKEVIIFPVAHDPATRAKVVRYLGAVGGISV